MKKIIILSTILILCSCQNNKEYKTIHYFYDSDFNGKLKNILSEEEIIVKAKDDTTAYIKGYMRLKTAEKIREGSSFPRKYESFKIYNEQGLDITNIEFKTKSEQMKKVDQDVLSNVKSIGEYSKDVKKSTNIDSVTIKKLKVNFKEITDKFDSRGITWVQHINTPKYRNQNGFYCYFAKNDNNVGNFRFVWQYYANDWLFIEKIIFLVDGKPIDYYPVSANRDHDTDIWEWGDENVKSSDIKLIESIANAKTVEVRFVGRQYTKDKKMSSNSIKSIKETLEYYKALGGEL